MFIESNERTTGMGATRYTAVAAEGRWVKVSHLEGARYHGRDNGVEMFSIHVPDPTPSARFYRSNSGRESVTISRGLHDPEPVSMTSFEDADRWLAEWSTAH